MKRSFRYTFIVLTILGVSCSTGDKNKTEKTVDAGSKEEVVMVAPLLTQQVARSVEYTANLEPFREIHLAPATPGRIDAINVEVGSRVAAGTVLVQMDRTQLHQAEVQLKTSETDFKRFDTLQKVGSVPQQQYDQMQSQLEVARSNVAFLRDNTRLKAPFSGVISGKYFEPGEMYSGAPVPTIGQAAIVSLVQIDRLKAKVPISEKYFPLIKTGMIAKVSSDIYPDKTFDGRIFNIYPTIDAASRTFIVEISVDNHKGVLRPGMFSRVTLDLDQVEAMLLPAIAVLKMQGSNERYLFVEENGKARRISVTLGKRFNEQVEVISDGLKKGDRVIVSGQARLLDGMAVKVVEKQ